MNGESKKDLYYPKKLSLFVKVQTLFIRCALASNKGALDFPTCPDIGWETGQNTS